MSIYSPRVSLAWLLTISGVGVRYWCGKRPPARSQWGSGPDYLDIEAIIPQSISTQSDSLDELGAVAKHGAIKLTLASRGPRAVTGDPRLVLCRASKRGARRFTKVLQTLDHETTDLVEVLVDEDVSGWPTTDGQYIFHIGQECLRASGTATTPNRFTGVKRAQLGSRPQEHLYTPKSVPLAYSEPVTWRTRRAVLSCAQVRGNRDLEVTDYVEVIRGFIDTSPSLGSDGVSVDVAIAPLTALIETSSSSARVTHLLRDQHRFNNEKAATFGHTQLGFRGEIVNQTVSGGPYPSGDSAMHFATDDVAKQWSDNADPILDEQHPRRVPLMSRSSSDYEIPISRTGADLDVTDPPGTLNAWNDNQEVVNVGVWEPKTIRMADGMYRWPHDVLAAIKADWCPGTTQGVGGAWVDLAVLEPGDEGTPVISCRLNSEHIASGIHLEFRANWALPGLHRDRDYWNQQPYVGWDPSEICHYGLQWCKPDAPWFDPRRVGALGEADRRGVSHGAWVREENITTRADDNETNEVYEIRGWPRCFYQTGEDGWVAEDQVMSPDPLGPYAQFASVRWKEDGNELAQVTKVYSVDADASGDGFYYILADGWSSRTRSFGDWGTDRAEIRPVSAWSKKPAWEVVLSTLMSGRGRNTNGSLDYQPFGADIHNSDLDVGSFSITNAGCSLTPDEWSPIYDGSRPLKEFLQPILTAMGCTIVMRNVNGQQVVGLARIGVPTDDPVLDITSQDLGINGRPESEFADESVIRYKITANYDWIKDEPSLTAYYIDTPALTEAGGDSGREAKIELRGYEFDPGRDVVAQALPLIQEMRSRVGSPRRVYRFRVARGLGMRLALGDVITLTAPDATGYDGSWGVSAVKCRVIGREINHTGEDFAEIRVVSYEANTSGWAPAMEVDSAPDADHVVVLANSFSDATDPRTHVLQSDVDYFRVGDSVEIVPPGDWAGRSTGIIASISGHTVGITGHGASPGWTIRPSDYDSSLPRMRGYVFAAGSSGTLGADEDEAKDWG